MDIEIWNGFCCVSVRFKMAATEPKAVTEVAKMDLFEDDDEFEEFEINEGMWLHLSISRNSNFNLNCAISFLGFWIWLIDY